jgi:hypothetical protein
MRRISCGKRFPALAILGLCQTGCASPHWAATQVDDSSYLASTASLQSNGVVFGEAIRKCREAVLKAVKPYGVVDIAFWGVEAVPAGYGGPVVSTGVRAVFQHLGGLEAPGAAVGCHFGEKGAVIIAQR